MADHATKEFIIRSAIEQASRLMPVGAMYTFPTHLTGMGPGLSFERAMAGYLQYHAGTTVRGATLAAAADSISQTWNQINRVNQQLAVGNPAYPSLLGHAGYMSATGMLNQALGPTAWHTPASYPQAYNARGSFPLPFLGHAGYMSATGMLNQPLGQTRSPAWANLGTHSPAYPMSDAQYRSWANLAGRVNVYGQMTPPGYPTPLAYAEPIGPVRPPRSAIFSGVPYPSYQGMPYTDLRQHGYGWPWPTGVSSGTPNTIPYTDFRLANWMRTFRNIDAAYVYPTSPTAATGGGAGGSGGGGIFPGGTDASSWNYLARIREFQARRGIIDPYQTSIFPGVNYIRC